MSAKDIVSGNARLNFAFAVVLYKFYPKLESVNDPPDTPRGGFEEGSSGRYVMSIFLKFLNYSGLQKFTDGCV